MQPGEGLHVFVKPNDRYRGGEGKSKYLPRADHKNIRGVPQLNGASKIVSESFG
jgi:hypothetical protein